MSEQHAELSLVADATDLRAMHDMIALSDGGTLRIFECDGWTSEKPVDRALALAGFLPGSAASPVRVRVCTCDRPIVVLKSFAFPLGSIGRVEMMVRMAMAGNLGGFMPLVAGQTGFHRAAVAFEHVWNAAGRPPIRTVHPELVQGSEASGESPASLLASAVNDPRVAAVIQLADDEEREDAIAAEES
ncbi:MAG: hypothetical protein IPK82_42545 [Polyangiaceae bacterium]|nr:hypothetical protein [Polyangiaceae bacterium]